VLLCLVGHASVVIITHQHGWAQRVSRAASGKVEVAPGNGPRGPLGTSTDRCLSCLLQRNFVSDIRPVPIPPDLCLEPLIRELFISEAISNGVPLVLSDRSPPLA